MLNQAAIVAARAEHTAINDEDLREGHLRALAGPERASQSMRDDERKLVAWHEAGHVLAAELCETQDKAQRVTIRARGQAAGLAVYGQTDRALHSRRFVHEQMICVLAGRAAEELLVDEISSGAANDLQQVNMLARRAVTEFGFSERLGQLIDRAHGQELRLGDDTRRDRRPGGRAAGRRRLPRRAGAARGAPARTRQAGRGAARPRAARAARHRPGRRRAAGHPGAPAPAAAGAG